MKKILFTLFTCMIPYMIIADNSYPWFVNTRKQKCIDTNLDKSMRIESIENSFKGEDGGCRKTINVNSNFPENSILLLECYAKAEVYPFFFSDTEENCNALLNYFKKE